MFRQFLVAIGVSALLTSVPLAQAQQPSVPETAAAPAAAAPALDAMEGTIAYYGRKFAGRRTASGQRFDPNALTMAHNTLPFGTRVRVTNLKNNKSVLVRVNDRGPTTPGRIGDLSLAAARRIGMVRSGIVEARLEVVSMGRQR